jgi:hypothetical protein
VGSHPINLALRFGLELAALAAMGLWGWHVTAGVFRVVLAVAIPVVAAVLWGVLAVPGDPSRSGSTFFATPGAIRLVFELAFFAFAVWALIATDHARLAAAMAAIVVVHYAISYDRIGWLLAR